MSAYEQRIEPPDKRWQYLLFAAEPYETISFKIPSREVDKSEGKFWTLWNKDTKQFFLQFAFRLEFRGGQDIIPSVKITPGIRSQIPPPPLQRPSLPPPARLPPGAGSIPGPVPAPPISQQNTTTSPAGVPSPFSPVSQPPAATFIQQLN